MGVGLCWMSAESLQERVDNAKRENWASVSDRLLNGSHFGLQPTGPRGSYPKCTD